TEFDVLVVVEGKTLLARENLEKIRDMVTDLQLVEGVRGLVSLFSARQAPEPGKLPAALFPPELPEGAAYEKFAETVKSNDIILGILAGCIIAIIFFRKISFMVVAAFPPIIAILLALGGLGWAGFNLNMFLNVMTPLIMVISFSDSMQLTFAARDRLIAGQDK